MKTLKKAIIFSNESVSSFLLKNRTEESKSFAGQVICKPRDTYKTILIIPLTLILNFRFEMFHCLGNEE